MRDTGYDDGYKQGLRDGKNGLSFNKNRGLPTNVSRRYASDYREGYEEGYSEARDGKRGYSRGYYQGYDRRDDREYDRRDNRRDNRREDQRDVEEVERVSWISRLASLFAGTKCLGHSVVKGASQLSKIQANSRRVQCNEKLEYGEPYEFEEGSFVCIYDDN